MQQHQKKRQKNLITIGLANAGHAKSQYELGKIYLDDKKFADAVEWLTKAAKQRYPEANTLLVHAQFELGLNLMVINKVESLKWITQAAKQGYPPAETYVGQYYLHGTHVPVDEKTAVIWLTKAAEKKFPPAQLYLFEYNFFKKGDKLKGFEWLNKAANQGYQLAVERLGHAQYDIAICYLEGKCGLMKNEEEGFKWLAEAALKGYAPAENRLNAYYIRGSHEGVKKAIKWLSKAAEKNDAGSQFLLFQCYFFNKGHTLDKLKGFEWMTKAANQGYKPAVEQLGSAQFDIALCYYQGKCGFTKNDIAACKWLNEAAEQGHQEAKNTLYNFISKLHRRAEEGLMDEQYFLGLLYLDGVGVPKDTTTAYKFFKAAADKGHLKALNFFTLTKYVELCHVCQKKAYFKCCANIYYCSKACNWTDKHQHKKDCTRKICVYCKMDATFLCADCKSVSYCCAACQKADWKKHKSACQHWTRLRMEYH